MYGLWYILWLLYTTNAFVLVIDKSTHSTRLRDDNENNCIYQKYMDGNSMTGYYTANQISDHPRKSVTKLSRRADRITSHLFFFIYFFLFLFLPHQTQSHVVWRKWLTSDLWVMEWKKEKEKTPSSSEKNAYLSVRILYKLYYVYLNVCFPVQHFIVYQPIYLHRQTQREREKTTRKWFGDIYCERVVEDKENILSFAFWHDMIIAARTQRVLPISL